MPYNVGKVVFSRGGEYKFTPRADGFVFRVCANGILAGILRQMGDLGELDFPAV
jgi:hypothetical protein